MAEVATMTGLRILVADATRKQVIRTAVLTPATRH